MQSTFPIRIGIAADLQELRSSFAGRAFLTISATAFVAICAHVSVPLYLTPVPVTLQTLGVILVGLMLGPTLGFSALLAYLVEGALGLPVFSPHGVGGAAQLLGPTGGYLFSYPLAAATAGAVVRAWPFRRFQFCAAVVAGITAGIPIFAMGSLWLAHWLHLTPTFAWRLAVLPFLPGEILKIAAAASAYGAIRRWNRS